MKRNTILIQWQATLALFMVLVASATTQAQITNQRVFDTIPFIMGHHEQRLDQFEAEPVTSGKMVMLGNSITEAGPWDELIGAGQVVNRGIGGDITYGILNRLDEIISHNPSKLFLMIGINDIGKDIPDQVIAENVRMIISRLKERLPKASIYLQSILPVNGEYPGFPQHYDKADHVLMTNQLLHRVAMDMDVTFVNLYPYFLDQKLRLDPTLTGDGLHLNDKGYRRWVDLLRKWGHL